MVTVLCPAVSDLKLLNMNIFFKFNPYQVTNRKLKLLRESDTATEQQSEGGYGHAVHNKDCVPVK